MRRSRVSRPLSTTQALNGASDMPPLLSTGKNFSVTMAWLAHRAPAITRPWPSRYLVPECMMMSAPNSTGRCRAGVAKQLSSASRAPALWAISASAWMSHTSVRGLVGVSANSSRVLLRIAACQAAVSVCDTKVDSTPKRARSVPMSRMVEPNIEREHTMWSPALSRARHIIKMADMPEAVPMAASVPSSAASRCSKLLTVGLP